MTSRPKALDLFCGAGGASMGLHRAGFDVVGIDNRPQPRYPFPFIQADALKPPVRLEDFDLVWASPPCQGYTNFGRNNGHPLLIEPVRDALRASGVPYVIENVVGAPLLSPTVLCGSMFGLHVRRHRLFETSFPVMASRCTHNLQHEIRAYYGKKGWLVWTPKGAQVQKRGRKPLLRGSVALAEQDMGIGWMETWGEVREAIPPAYSEHIGRYALMALGIS